MDTTQPPRKRARPAEDDEQASGYDENPDTNPPITRSSDYWFEDGSIILHAEATYFRVHRSVLSRHSTVFRDMFEIPQPVGDEPEVEGCLIVQVSDTVADITHMLASLYDKTTQKDRRLTFARVSAWLRLGQKYDIEYQYAEALQVLQSEFPSTLKKWQAKGSTAVGKYIKKDDGLLFDVVNLGIETNTLSILPVAFLTLVGHHTTRDIMTGVERKDGSRATIPSNLQLTCLTGRDKLLQSTILTFNWLPKFEAEFVTPSQDLCCSQDACNEACYRCMAKLSERASDPFFALNALDKLEPFILYCAPCTVRARTSHALGQQLAWRMLPTNFGLTSWDEVLR